MPNEKGELTSGEKQSVINFMTAQGVNKPCPFCGNPQWFVADFLVFAPVFMRERVFGFGTGFPAAVVVCNRCGFLRFHSALKIGLVVKDPSDGKLLAAAEDKVASAR
jgi:hypothetical protein